MCTPACASVLNRIGHLRLTLAATETSQGPRQLFAAAHFLNTKNALDDLLCRGQKSSQGC